MNNQKEYIIFEQDTMTRRSAFMVDNRPGHVRFEHVFQSQAKKFTLIQAVKISKSLNKNGSKTLRYGYFKADY